VGVGIVFVLFPVLGVVLGWLYPSSIDHLWEILSWFGILVAGAAGYGGHDFPGVVLLVIADIVFYWALAFLVMWLMRRGKGPPAHEIPPEAC